MGVKMKEKQSYNITVVGTGYVGLSIAVLLSQHNNVTAVDIIPEKIELINQKKSPIADREIEEYLSGKELNLIGTTDSKYAYEDADIIIIATPTNYNMETNQFDTSSIEEVLESAIEINPEALLVVKSTIPIGYIDSIKKRYQIDNIIFSPEFLREGHALYDNLYPSRIIVGAAVKNKKVFKKAKLFANLLRSEAIKKNVKVLLTNPTEAEAVKLFANTYLAMRVSFFNELDTYAEMKGLDSKAIIEGIGMDTRIGMYYNNPSFGYGGYCLPKDTKQLLADYKEIPQKLISAIIESNEIRKEYIANRILEKSIMNKNMERNETGYIVVGIYRLIMKAGSDNFRQSAIQDVINRLKEKKVDIVIYEPTIKKDTFYNNKLIENLENFKSMSHIIIANRVDSNLIDVQEKVYSRDIYGRD